MKRDLKVMARVRTIRRLRKLAAAAGEFYDPRGHAKAVRAARAKQTSPTARSSGIGAGLDGEYSDLAARISRAHDDENGDDDMPKRKGDPMEMVMELPPTFETLPEIHFEAAAARFRAESKRKGSQK